MRKNLLCIPLIAVLLAGIFMTDVAKAPIIAEIYVDPPITIGMESFSINISIGLAIRIQAWYFLLSFDPNVLQAHNITEGPFLRDALPEPPPEVTTKFVGTINNVIGTVKGVCSFIPLTDPTEGASGFGVLATVTFNVTQQWKSHLNFTETELSQTEPNPNPPPDYRLKPVEHTSENGLYLSFPYHLYLLARAYGTSVGEPGYNLLADLDSDDDVDLDDLNLYAENYRQ